MVIDIKIRKEIEEKARLLEKRKEQTIDYVKKEIDSIIERLRIIEKDLIDEINSCTNTYGELLVSIDSDNYPTEDEIERILANEISSDFGPNVDSFNSLRKEIESFRLWKDKNEKKTKLNPFDIIPKNIKITSTSHDSISVCWDKVDCDCYYEVELESSSTQKIYQTQKINYSLSWLNSGTEYKIRVRTVLLEKGIKSIWNDPITIRTECNFSDCVWKECPDGVAWGMKYSINMKNSKVSTKIGTEWSTIIGNIHIPLNKVTSWNIKALKSHDGDGLYVGVAPFDINQYMNYNFNKCGWYFCCWNSTLCSGPPHNYNGKEYGSRKGNGQYVHTGDVVGVVIDTTKGELSLIVSGVDYGIAYEGIPLDKPLVPCVLLGWPDDSVGLII